MKHVSIDTETLGTRAGCAVLSIGAVAFDYTRQLLGPSFYTVISRRSCKEAGLFEDRGTLAWWNRQSEQARSILREASSGGETLDDALDSLAAYLRQFGSDVRVWSCGADFDLPILGHLYAISGRPQPWKYANSRCYRTLKNLATGVAMERGGVHHNALDDAKSQATHAMKILAQLAKVQS